MFAYIIGTLEEIDEDYIVIDNHGIGYEIYVSKSTLYQFKNIGEQVKVYTYLYIKEDLMQLFGFYTKEEMQLFMLLISVGGIGPKGALAILGILSPSDLRFAILAEDAKAISQAPGIGAKTAQRVILDLKDKVDKVEVSGISAQVDDTNAALKRDVLDAMTSLGFTSSQTLRALEEVEISENSRVEDVIKAVLQKIS